MSFLHPWAIWVGVVAAGLPLVIHLLSRPRPVRMPLSTLRFVHEAIKQRRARHRLRDLLILCLRTLAVLLLAVAIARPQRGEQPPGDDGQRDETVRVVIVDTSQSMAATQRAVQAIERARTTAAGLLRYRPGLSANLILAAATPQAVFAGPSTNFGALRDQLNRCRPLPERLNSRRALEMAAGMLTPQSPGDRRRFELVIVSDFQRANWAGADFSLLPEKTEIRLESVAPPVSPENVAILSADCRQEGALGRSIRLAVEVGNFSPTPRRVTVEVDVGERTCRLEGTCRERGRTTLSEEYRQRQEGWFAGQARLLGVRDALADDDVRPLTLHVRPKPLYVLLSRQPPSLRPSSSHFLECALVPDAELGEKAAARLTRLDPSQLGAQALAPATLILLDHPGKLSGDAIGLMVGLMRRGRPILYVAGEPIDATNLKRFAAAAGSGLQMPVEFTPPPPGRPRQGLLLASVDRGQPPFSVFGDSLTAVTSRLRFSGGLGTRRLEGALADDVLASYSDGTTCLMLSFSDAGALAVLNADLAASDLPKTPAFVPILEELVARMLNRDRAAGGAVCGEQLVVRLPADVETSAGLEITGPPMTEAQSAEPSFGTLMDERTGVVWHWPHPTRPGVYQVRRGDTPVFAVAVDVPAEESDLESLPPDVLKNRLAAGRKVYYCSATSEATGRDDAWTWLLTACTVCMLGAIGVMLGFRT
jgi:hypothetical protein